MNAAAVIPERPQWRSKGAFVLAAYGCGFGSFFRFPFIALRYGGASFLYAYTLLMIIFGFPALVLELVIGQSFQQGVVGSITKIHPRFRGVGVYATVISMVICSFFCVVSSWSVHYLWGSFQYPLPWHTDDPIFYFQKGIHIGNPTDSPHAQLPILITLLLTWVFVYGILFRGIRSLAIVAYIAIPTVSVILILLLLRSLVLENAISGVKVYFQPDASLWASSELWLAALAQTHSSLGLGTGVMPALGSHNRRSRDVVKWAAIITLASILYSLSSGLATFSVLGHLHYFQSAAESTENLVQNGSAKVAFPNVVFGPELVYVVLPEAIAALPKGICNIVAVLLFVGIFIVGIISAWSYALAVTTVVSDMAPNFPQALVGLVVCVVGAGLGIVYTFSYGYFLLEVMNYFIPSFCITGIVLLESVAVGYFSDSTSLMQKVRERGRSGIQRMKDFISIGSFYSIEKIQDRINITEKTRVNKFIWGSLIKYLLPIITMVLILEELVLLFRGGLGKLPRRPEWIEWYIIMWGWISLIFFVVIPTIFALLPQRMVATPSTAEIWTKSTDQDTMSQVGDLDFQLNSLL